jgi:nicotinate-nucleotide adenylyltransferase
LRVPEAPARIGIFGGTFDPPHAGHVAAARAVGAQLGLDRLLLVVANDPWQKSGERAVSPAADRYALTEVLAREIRGAEASRLELDRGGPSYSIDTAEEILAGAGEAPVELYLVIGADLVPGLETWHRAEDLRHMVTLAIVSRPTDPVTHVPPGWRAEWIDGPQVPVSSSQVRALLTEGRSVEDLVPEPVIRCISRRALYAVP